ncbi:hypothetical protein TrLO_g13906 [Triparma laevis f. longispina]|uniref:Uncharacterized protein n=1 Tax=Triparma laevis f. longispina TaxID=1714387 RepID=A0A9W6ZDN0_9STRA|nr:hypothetical protein TrLO_g13906 [Triparma laevis f. longispina]
MEERRRGGVEWGWEGKVEGGENLDSDWEDNEGAKPVEVGTRIKSCGSGTSGEVYVNETGDQEYFACTVVGARLTASGSIVYDLGYDDGDEACNVSSEMILVKSRVKSKTKTKTKAKDEVEVEESEEESYSDSNWGDEARDEREESENSDNDWGEEEEEEVKAKSGQRPQVTKPEDNEEPIFLKPYQ